MSSINQVILYAVSGAVTGAFFFGLYLVILMWLYISLYGYFSIGFFGSLPKPVLSALIIGLIFGSVQGLAVGLFIRIYNINSLSKGVLVGFVVTEIIAFGFYLLFSIFDHPNPVDLIFGFIQDDLFGLIKISLVLFIPSAATGATLTRFISFITSK